MATLDYSYDESSEDFLAYKARFYFENEDGSGLTAGIYEINLYASCSIIVE